ncbi:hypothetical protein [Neobacillus drentensis]|uniref:hypothetical protein n=1 Tax=Neobacillus drentensis TaxID=220684 RepID=UPI003001B0F6
MGYPVKKLSDILTNSNEILRLNPNFFTFILYKKQHKIFRNYILKEFNHLHYLSKKPNAILFVLDNPLNWLQRADIEYYQDIQGREYQPELNDDEVDVVCEYFKIHPDSLPAVIIFNNLHSQSCTSISLKGINEERILSDFFEKLFARENDYGIVREESMLYGNGKEPFFLPPFGAKIIQSVETQFLTYKSEKTIFQILSGIVQQLNRIENKIDTILTVIQNLQYDIETIKRTRRNEEDKLNLIYKKIDRKITPLKLSLGQDIKDYEELLKDLIENWDILDPLSKEMLPLAEYLFDQMSRLNDVDYSPVILQYCRSLENEILQKLFIQFAIHIYQKIEDLEGFLKGDLENEKTKQFAKVILSSKNKDIEDVKFTLGQMIRILEYTAGKRTIKESPLLQEFKQFITQNFNETNILSKDYLSNIKSITDDFRNRCAHPYKLNEEDAIQCKEIVPQDINNFLRFWKNGILT